VGNFWVDLTRGIVRVLLPLAAVSAVVLIASGVVQNLAGGQAHATLAGAQQTILGGPVASWEPIKLISGDGRRHGRMVGDRRQGWALLVVAGILFVGALAAATAAPHAHHNTVPVAVGTANEGTETRFGVPGGALFGVAATGSADGAANSSYDSFSSLGGGVLMATIMLGEVSPGGAGSGLYGLLMMALLAAFIGGLTVGRTPEYLRKRLQAREVKLISLYVLTTPALILIGTALAVALPTGRASIANTGPHGLSEIAYAFTSNANSNGSAFGGFTGNTPFYNPALAIVMLLGRYLPIVFVLALAGSLARQRQPPPRTAARPRTRRRVRRARSAPPTG
jgi:K+-transporting ATPase ATPase A chain